MRVISAILAVALALALEAGLGRLWPSAGRWIDPMMLPVVWFATAGSQRSGMLVGCAAGLLEGAWFRVGAFGLDGFKKTCVGYVLGGLGSRFDLDQPFGRAAAGVAAVLIDSIVNFGLLGLLDQRPAAPSVFDLLVPAGVTGGSMLLIGSVVDRFDRRRHSPGG